MNADLNELKLEREMTAMLYSYVQMVRRTKNRPDLAKVAAEREIRLKLELDTLEHEVALREERELPLADNHEVVA